VIFFYTVNCQAQWLKLNTSIAAEDNMYDSIVVVISDESGNVNRLSTLKKSTLKLKLNNHYQVTYIKPDAVAYKFEVHTHLPVKLSKKIYSYRINIFLEKLNPVDAKAQ